jgi:hypothetical protein
VRHLRQGRQRTFERVRNDVVVPRSFYDVSVFIDDCCASSAPATIFNPGPYDLTVTVNGGPEGRLMVSPNEYPGPTRVTHTKLTPGPRTPGSCCLLAHAVAAVAVNCPRCRGLQRQVELQPLGR